MRIILSPAKQMVRTDSGFPHSGEPALMGRAQEVLSYLQGLSYAEAEKLWGCSERLLKPKDRMVTCVFGELVGDKVVQKGVYAKMAGGDMVHYMAENAVGDPEDVRGYARLGYEFDPSRSTEDEYVFLK